MFIDNARKIIFISVPGTDSENIEDFFKEQFENNSVEVLWGWSHYTENVSINQEQIDEIKNKPAEEKQTIINQLYSDNLNKIATIQNIVNNNLLTSPLSEYQVYAVCREPLIRTIITHEISSYNAMEFGIREQTIRNREALEPSALNENIIASLIANFISNIGNFEGDKANRLGAQFKTQSFWVKNGGQVINKLYAYENYLDLIADICSKYSIDPSLYDDRKRHGSRKSNITVDSLSDELKTKILEHYAEDKTLYESIPGTATPNSVSSLW